MISYAAVLVLAAVGVLSLMDATIKGLAAGYPTFQIAFLRFAAGSIAATALLAVLRPGRPSPETIAYNVSRALLVVVTATTFFYALGQLPLADTVALAFLAPILQALFGALLLRERLDLGIALGLAAGLCGMLLIMGGGIGSGTYGPEALYGVIAVLVSTVTYALALVLLRARATRDALIHIVWFQNTVPALVLAIPAWLVWQPVALRDAVIFAGVGCLGVAGHYLMGMAFARAEVSRLAPLDYSALLWAATYGFLIYGEQPTITTWLGAALIVAATVGANRARRT